ESGVDGGVELNDAIVGQDVHRAAGQIPSDDGDAVGVDFGVEDGHRPALRISLQRHAYTRSIMVAAPMPLATQSVMRAVPWPVRSSSSSAVPRIMAPVAPRGWPMAMAPPLTLTRAGSA